VPSVKGSLFVDFVKTIRANKTGAYDSYLFDEDRKVLEGRILPSSWYPFETYKRCFQAVGKVVAHGSDSVYRGWGRQFCDEIMLSIYKRMLSDTSPMQTMRRYVSMFSMFYDFGTLELEERSENEVVLAFRDFDRDFAELYQLFYGWIERSLELSGAKDVQMNFLTCSWLGAPDTRFQIQWTA